MTEKSWEVVEGREESKKVLARKKLEEKEGTRGVV
jgi:hypothetical protein